MHDDADFVRKLMETPADDTARRVYADWLDEQADPVSRAKAGFLRLELRMALLPERSLNRVLWQKKLQTMAVGLDPGWLAAVSHPKLEACRLQFQFPCPKQWEKLQPTDDGKVRFCDSCRQQVYYCDTIPEAQTQAANGRCVAVSVALVRRADDIQPIHSSGVRAGGIQLEVMTRDGMEVVVTERLLMGRLPRSVRRPPKESRRPSRGPQRSRNRNIQTAEWEDETA